MIISDEQVRRAVEYLRSSDPDADQRLVLDGTSITPELIDRVQAAIASMPDARPDRVDEAREEIVDGPGVSPAIVADKLIGRVISDSLR
jgi:hypothetical protein